MPPMTPPLTLRSTSLLAALALLPVLALAGCGGDDQAADEPGPSPSATFVPESRIKVSAALPPGFPKDDVPLLDSPVAAASAGEPGSGYAWSVVMQPAGDVEDVVDDAGDLLDEAGYEVGAKTDAGRLQVRRYDGDRYSVSLTVVGTETGTSVTYLITKK